MGVRYLNNLIGEKCKSALTLRGLADYANKTIVVDTSIYIYQFLGENALMERMYLMMALFKLHNITPIFVFEGAAPQEKQHTLRERSSSRKCAELDYVRASAKLTILREQLQITIPTHRAVAADAADAVEADAADAVEADACKINSMETAIYELRKRCVRVRGCELLDLKRLMRAFDMRYIEADGESDNVCAQIVKMGIAHACMSNDMDMLLYGCPRVLRHFNLDRETVIEYSLSRILNILDVSICEFREICILSGTDYNPHNFDSSIRHRIYLSNIFERYYRFRESTDYGVRTFYEWMKNISWLFRDIDVRALQRVRGIFSVNLTNDQSENINGVLQRSVKPVSSVSSVSSVSAAESFEVPIRVKKIMAQYNFIYI